MSMVLAPDRKALDAQKAPKIPEVAEVAQMTHVNDTAPAPTATQPADPSLAPGA
jgi:hypothetical protein